MGWWVPRKEHRGVGQGSGGYRKAQQRGLAAGQEKDREAWRGESGISHTGLCSFLEQVRAKSVI